MFYFKSFLGQHNTVAGYMLPVSYRLGGPGLECVELCSFMFFAHW